MAYENELDRELGESERAARVYRDIDAYVNKGGRDLEEEHLALAQSGEEKEKIRNLWHKGRRARLALVGARFDALRPKIEEVANDPNLGRFSRSLISLRQSFAAMPFPTM
jgi:hypothetical protein